jgi:hypothetical protein
MSWTEEDYCQAETLVRDWLLGLYEAGKYRELCERYCHEGWFYGLNDAGELVEAGICSFTVTEGTEAEALAVVAAHIREQVLAGVHGC